MNVVGFAGFSGSGKTTLVERLIHAFRNRALCVSVVKHAHHGFEIDHPGKDTHRQRAAGAYEVVVASSRRLALICEFEQTLRLSVHELIAELRADVDWVLVEGFKDSDLLKIEVRREQSNRPARDTDDKFIVTSATDAPQRLSHPTDRCSLSMMAKPWSTGCWPTPRVLLSTARE